MSAPFPSSSSKGEESYQRESIDIRRLLWAGPLAAIIAAGANLVVYLVAQGLLGVVLLAPAQPGAAEFVPMPATAVIIMSIIPALGATLLLAILSKVVARPIRTFWIIAAVVLLLSFITPFSLPITWDAIITLELMHVIAALVIVGILTTVGRKR